MCKTVIPGVGAVQMPNVSQDIDADREECERPHGPMESRVTCSLKKRMNTLDRHDDDPQGKSKADPGVIKPNLKNPTLICEFKEEENQEEDA